MYNTDFLLFEYWQPNAKSGKNSMKVLFIPSLTKGTTVGSLVTFFTEVFSINIQSLHVQLLCFQSYRAKITRFFVIVLL